MTAPNPEEVQAMQLVSAYGSDKGGLTGDGSHVEVHAICLAGGIASALLAARAAGRREGIKESCRRINSHRFTHYAVAEPGAAIKWNAALELECEVRALLAHRARKEGPNA